MKNFLLIAIPLALFATLGFVSYNPIATEDAPVYNAPNNPITGQVVALDLRHLADLNRLPKSETVDIEFDHFFKTTKKYEAVSLREVLMPYLQEMNLDADADPLITFHCSDGYQPTKRLSELAAGEGYLAFRDLTQDEPNHEDWPEDLTGKMAPFYLVWKDVPYENQEFTWPYGLEKIEINPLDTMFTSIFPAGDPAAIAGFQQFKHYCIKCHSIDKVGGNVGPDFNYPKNITEYWDAEHMWEFAKDPQSYRYNARMTPITPMTRNEFDQIIIYLEYLRDQK